MSDPSEFFSINAAVSVCSVVPFPCPFPSCCRLLFFVEPLSQEPPPHSSPHPRLMPFSNVSGHAKCEGEGKRNRKPLREIRGNEEN